MGYKKRAKRLVFDRQAYYREYYANRKKREFTEYPATKVCVNCKEEKPGADFYKNRLHSDDGLDYYCKYCRLAGSMKSHRKSKSEFKCAMEDCTSDRGHYARGMCRNCYTRAQRNNGDPTYYSDKLPDSVSHPDHPLYEANKAVRLFTSYRLTLEEWEEMASKGCQICGDTENIHKFHTDHDHACCEKPPTCGKCTRGILCPKCNISVGHYENSRLREDYPNYKQIAEYVYAWHQRKDTDA